MLPWKSASPEQQQREFIEVWLRGEMSFKDLCRRFAISRKTGYKRVARFQAFGWEGLADRSRAPHVHPNRTELQAARLLVMTKRQHAHWGPRKLVPYLAERHPGLLFPAPSTAGEILRRAGLVRPRRRGRRVVPGPLLPLRPEEANEIWCIDWKGWFRTGDGRRCDPLTVSDHASRFLLACESLERPRGPEVRRALERLFQTYGLPRALRSDNGPPFASMGLGGLSQLSIWWIRLGILPDRILPGHPEQNGRHERMHRTLKQQTASPPKATWRAQQRAFDAFRQEYNEERPHEALGQRPPSSCYQPSSRPYPAQLPEPQYARDMIIRRVRTNGEIRWKRDKVYVSEALRGELVGIQQEDDRFFTVQFGPLRVGLLDDYRKTITRVPVEVLPMSPV